MQSTTYTLSLLQLDDISDDVADLSLKVDQTTVSSPLMHETSFEDSSPEDAFFDSSPEDAFFAEIFEAPDSQ